MSRTLLIPDCIKSRRERFISRNLVKLLINQWLKTIKNYFCDRWAIRKKVRGDLN